MKTSPRRNVAGVADYEARHIRHGRSVLSLVQADTLIGEVQPCKVIRTSAQS
jgi:hypothetical protein